ncbi:NADH:flavin oxidoreductase [Nocardioides sp. GY 10113]|uniref:NADH:flavin oxidoreductase n=1 Tax=Nocardioides sp. GY 10113 TaxID=2569761 RepID=UPI0010A83D5E|nr:NADH:flavin oxidoreductase [Nocardioides sp. GY 10113]TIC88343.1 NADH:flavin oxidoreductase [Nocardioides sp. GY 10113]
MTAPDQPLSLTRGPAWRNRFALAPLTNTQSHDDGTLSEDEHRWLTARGEGGFGLVMTCAAYVVPTGQAWRGQLGVADDEHEASLRDLASSIRATGAVSSIQLHHGGRRADPTVTGRPNEAPWDDPDRNTVALTTEGVERVVADFVAAAARAERAGFDGVEVHGAHGYLLGQFLDDRHNRRTDRYGGSLENRSRAMLEVVEGIRAATGPAFQLGLRLSPEGFGVPLAEGREVAAAMLGTGLLDYLDLSLWDVYAAPRGEGLDGRLIDRFTDLPRGGTRLGVAGKVLTAADAQWCLDQGADFATVGTGAILHHDFARRALADASFAARSRPVTREELRAEAVGPAFVEYLAAGWPDLVA